MTSRRATAASGPTGDARERHRERLEAARGCRAAWSVGRVGRSSPPSPPRRAVRGRRRRRWRAPAPSPSFERSVTVGSPFSQTGSPATMSTASSASAAIRWWTIPTRSRYARAHRVHRHDAAADVVADDDDRARSSADRRQAGATGPSSMGSMSVASSAMNALSHRVRPSMSTASAGSVAARAATRSVPTSIVGQVAGRSRRWRAIRSSSSGSPGHAVARNQTRPSPARRRRAREAPSALAAACPADREEQWCRHQARTAIDTEGDGDRQLDRRPQRIAIESVSTPRDPAEDEETGQGADRRAGEDRDRAGHEGCDRDGDSGDRPSRRRHRTVAVVPRTTPRNRRARPPSPQPGARDRHEHASGADGETGGGGGHGSAGSAGTAGASRHAREGGDLRTDDHDERHDPAGPGRRVTARDLGADGVGRHQRIRGVGQTVEMQTSGRQGHHPDRDDRGEDGFAGTGDDQAGQPAECADHGHRPTGTRPRRSHRRAAGASEGG